ATATPRAQRNPVCVSHARRSGKTAREGAVAFSGGVSKAPPLMTWPGWPRASGAALAVHSHALPIRSTAPTQDLPRLLAPAGANPRLRRDSVRRGRAPSRAADGSAIHATRSTRGSPPRTLSRSTRVASRTGGALERERESRRRTPVPYDAGPRGTSRARAPTRARYAPAGPGAPCGSVAVGH